MVTEESGVAVRTLRVHDKKAIPFIKSAFQAIKKLSHPHLCALLKLVQGKHSMKIFDFDDNLVRSFVYYCRTLFANNKRQIKVRDIN